MSGRSGIALWDRWATRQDARAGVAAFQVAGSSPAGAQPCSVTSGDAPRFRLRLLRSGGGAKSLDLVASGDDCGVLSAHDLPEARTQVVRERLLVLGHGVILSRQGGSQDGACVVPGQRILERDPATVKGSRGALTLCPGLLLSEGGRPTQAAEAILRAGAALSFAE